MSMPQDPIRVGIAGLGRSGWAIHAQLLAPLTGKFQIAAVTDEDETRRAEAIERFDCQAYLTFDELIADPAIELVVVALPSFLYVPRLRLEVDRLRAPCSKCVRSAQIFSTYSTAKKWSRFARAAAAAPCTPSFRMSSKKSL